MSEENIIYGGRPKIPVPQVNFGQRFYDQLKNRNRNEVLFEDSASSEMFTVGEFMDKSCILSKTLSNFVQKDKVIAISSENNVYYFTVVLAALYAGIPIALLDPNYTLYELRSILSIIRPELLFCAMDQCPKFTRALVTYRSIRKIVVLDVKQNGKQFDSLDSFANRSSVDLSNFEIKDVDVKEKVAFILFSSGTTGLPKAVMLSHLSASATVSGVNDPIIKSPIVTKMTLGILPFFHVFGLYTILLSILDNKTVVVVKKFEPEAYLKTIEKYKIDRLSTVPALVQFLVKSPVVEKYDLSSVKELGCGAAPLSEALIEAVRRKLHLKEVRQGYGLTESGYGICITPYGYGRPGSVGVLYPGLSGIVRDVKTEKNLAPYTQGEICVKGDAIMKGYYGNPKATKEAFTKDGYLRTGDIGYYDNDAYFYIVDRMKEVIKYKGFQVPPAELEAILLTHPKIKDAGVIGKPDVDAGELPTAFVVKQPNVVLTENDVKFYLAGFVKRNKHLHGGVIFVDEIPRTSSGKIKRKDLKTRLNSTKSKL